MEMHAWRYITPESMISGERYVFQYSVTQHESSIGTRSRTLTVQKHGTSDGMDYHNRDIGMEVFACWVIDHSDNDDRKVFVSRSS